MTGDGPRRLILILVLLVALGGLAAVLFGETTLSMAPQGQAFTDLSSGPAEVLSVSPLPPRSTQASTSGGSPTKVFR